MPHATPTLKHAVLHSAPWLLALTLGGAAHVGLWLHELEHRHAVQRVAIPAPPIVVPIESETRPACVDPPKAECVCDQRPQQTAADIERMKAGIVCPSDSECILDRAFVNRLVREPAGFARQIRVVPAVRDGETVGFKLYGPANGLLKQLGLRRGDRVEAINGVSLRSLDALLQTMLGEAKPEYMVTLQRRGRTVHKRYRIVPSPYDDVPSR